MADDPTPDDPTSDPQPNGDPDPDRITPDDDWQAKSRKHEREAKKERKAREALEARIREIESSNQTDQEKALAQAREEARAEAKAEADQERRKDRLEVAVTRLAARDFADTEDALLHVDRGIAAGDIDPDDIYSDDGTVNTDALKTALDELLERKPHLKAGPNGRRPHGDADAGKGSGGGSDDDMNTRLRRAAGRA